MLDLKLLRTGSIATVGGAAIIVATCLCSVAAQDWDVRSGRLSRIEPGTFVTVRTTQSINSNRRDDRIYSGIVEEDVWDDYRRLAVPAIPRGSRVELVVRTARDGDLILDLDSVFVRGERYTVSATPERIESGGQVRSDDTAEFVGGGAVLGTIIGAIAGGGKGAAIGAATGAAAGLGLSFHGRSVRVPAESVLTFRLEEGLILGARRGRFQRDDHRRN
jgi:hypothetical protein